MLSVENVATPFTAATLVVPESVPPPGFAPSATVIVPVKPATGLPRSSRAVTRTAAIVWPAWVDVGCVVNAKFVAGGGGGGGGGGCVPGSGAAFSAKVVASHVSGEPMNQFHVGFAV